MSDTLLIAYYCTGHGLGHATRSIEVCKHLVARGHSVIVVTGVPSRIFQQQIPPGSFLFRKSTLDSGSKQLDPFTVDMKGSLEEYLKTCVVHRQALLDQEVGWLEANKVDLVVSDVVPIAFAAAHAARIPVVGVSNFSWDFIYSEYITGQRRPEYKEMVGQIAQDYALATLLLRLPGYVPMPAFPVVEDVPLVVRKAVKSREQVREELGLSPDENLAVMILGGHKGGIPLDSNSLPPSWKCIICGGSSWVDLKTMPKTFILAADDVYTPDLINASSCVVGKIGYGTTSECLAHNVPLVFIRREGFNEEPFLRKLLEVHAAAVEMRRQDLLAGRWAPYLERAATLQPFYSGPSNGAEVVAERLEEVVRRGPAPSLNRQESSKMLRLRDTIVWGYLMRSSRAASKKVDIPEWYVRGMEPSSSSSAHPTDDGGWVEGGGEVLQQWEVLHGLPDSAARPDTRQFLQLLYSLEQLPTAVSPTGEGAAVSPTAPEPSEVRAARGVMRWEQQVFISRAPGRLDVMGGIADYSGSLVLQLPIQEACHVALQLQEVGEQPLWKHIQARHESLGGAPRAALRIVSFGADLTNRGAAFDMDLGDLYPGGELMSYEAAQEYFKRDPATSWGAYAAGCLLVLSQEKGIQWGEQGIGVIIHSEVPEGKGVSSSAAVEVAVMTALLAAVGLELEGREVALLCQMVENRVVGAPCGVMDQMASSLGHEGRLLAMVCQPAEVQQPVSLPPHLSLWGVDSGIRHSVSGSDYTSVRVGAFMGMRIATEVLGGKQEEGRVPPACRGGYLTNIPPSEFEERVRGRLPESISGREFLDRYHTHYDPVTSISPDNHYAVAAPTTHPVHETFRVASFRAALLAGPSPLVAEVLGELMLQSHASYSSCGLGSDGTNRLVELVRAEIASAKSAGRQPAVWGAKITGGGCGGTVCILASSGPEGDCAVQEVVQRYAHETGHSPKVFSGSSPGAAAFGHLVVRKARHGLTT